MMVVPGMLKLTAVIEWERLFMMRHPRVSRREALALAAHAGEPVRGAAARSVGRVFAGGGARWGPPDGQGARCGSVSCIRAL